LAEKRARNQPAAQPNFEQTLDHLEEIVHLLEEGNIGLDEALARYEEGVKLLRRCYHLLERAERRIELLSGVDVEGNPIAEPFDGQAAGSLEEKAGQRSRRRSASPRSKADKGKPEGPQPGDTDVDMPGGLL
jgi:exodeoxyribonuclease VII small subunit